MKPPPFEYHRPASAAEVDRLLAVLGDEAKILSGGQSLIPLLNMRLVAPAHIIDIGNLTGEASEPVEEEAAVRIGALVRHAAVAGSSAVADRVPLLAETMQLVAHPAIRNRGTLVGALAHADPASELPAAAVLLGAEMLARSARGERTVAARDFFVGPLESALAPDEWLHAVRFPFQRGTGAAEEFSRRRGDYALCGVLALVTDRGAGLTYFGLAGMPDVLEIPGPVTPDGATDEAVAQVVDGRLDVQDDIHATAAYRAHLARRLGARALRRAVAGARHAGAAA